jgi:hypothetical protein
MDKKTFNSLKTGDQVTFLKRYIDMPYGWNVHMDAMVNKPGIIVHKSDDTVSLTPLAEGLTGKTYTAHYEYIELWAPIDLPKEPLETNHYKYVVKQSVDLQHFTKFLDDDYKNNVINHFIDKCIKDTLLVFNSDILEDVLQNFPQLLCYCIANGIIERVPK